VAVRRDCQKPLIASQPNAHEGSLALFRLGAASLGIFKNTKKSNTRGRRMMPLKIGTSAFNSFQPTECPNGSTALFRLGASSLGIFLLRSWHQKAVASPAVEPEGRPFGSGGFSAFNLPGPGVSLGGLRGEG